MSQLSEHLDELEPDFLKFILHDSRATNADFEPLQGLVTNSWVEQLVLVLFSPIFAIACVTWVLVKIFDVEIEGLEGLVLS